MPTICEPLNKKQKMHKYKNFTAFIRLKQFDNIKIKFSGNHSNFKHLTLNKYVDAIFFNHIYVKGMYYKQKKSIQPILTVG